MTRRLSYTPWAANGLAVAGIDRFELQGRIPDGWHFHGHAKHSWGEYVWEARRRSDGAVHTVSAYRANELPDAIERLFALVGEHSLEDQLAASLAARGIG